MEYITNIRGFLKFELKSLLGRFLLNDSPKLKFKINYLNLGCGSNVLEGYVNADFFYKFKFWKKFSSNYEWQLDLRYALNCPDNTFDGVFTEHTLEHLYPFQVEALLKEIYRIMKNSSYIRITVPDLEKYVNYYVGNYSGIVKESFDSQFSSPCSAIRNMSQNYLHISLWDFKELKLVLEKIGFRNIEKKGFREGRDEKLLLDIKERSWETLYIEAQK